MFKFIKKTDWTANNGNTGTTVVVALKGRVFTFNLEDFTKAKIDEEKGTVDLGEVPNVVKNPYMDGLGNQKMGLRLMPKMDLELSDF